MAALKGINIVDLINPRSRNLKALKIDLKTLEDDEALKLLKENPKIMYRPILTDGKKITIGFKEENFRAYIK